MLNEARRVKIKIKTQQMPQEQVKQIVSDGKALKTTMFLVSAIIFCLFPGSVYGLLRFIVGTIQYDTIQYNTLFTHATSRSDPTFSSTMGHGMKWPMSCLIRCMLVGNRGEKFFARAEKQMISVRALHTHFGYGLHFCN